MDMVTGGAEAIALVNGAYAGATTIFDDIYTRIEKVKNKKLSSNNLLRAYYFEVINNLELLNVINFEKFKKEKPNSGALASLIYRLETQIGATILFEEEYDSESDLYRLLEDKGRIRNNKNLLVRNIKGGEEDVNKESFYENILQAISFTVVKIEILRRLTKFSDSEMSILNTILLEKRITNIFQRFKMIKEKLEELKAISTVAR